MDRIIYHSLTLKCDPRKAFEMFTVNKNLEKWLTIQAEVEPKAGGKYELFWNPGEPENDSTMGCKVLAISPNKLLAFEWKGPKQFKHFMNDAKPLTSVVVSFIPRDEITEVHLIHTGWRDTEEWEEARQWFDKVWANALLELTKHTTDK